MIPAWGTFTSYGCMLFTLFIWVKGNFLNFCRKKTKNIIFYFFFSIFLIFLTDKSNFELNIILQFLYFSTIFFFRKNINGNLRGIKAKSCSLIFF